MDNNTNQNISNKNIKCPDKKDDEKPRIELVSPIKETRESSKKNNNSSKKSKFLILTRNLSK